MIQTCVGSSIDPNYFLPSNVTIFALNGLSFAVNEILTNPNWLVYITSHYQLPNKLKVLINIGDRSKPVCFQPGDSDLTSDFMDFTQLLLNLIVKCAPYLAWYKCIYFRHKLSIYHYSGTPGFTQV